jgi:citrate lyase subunit beta/citryl-CoA lyase
LKDADGFSAAIARSRRAGFQGRLCIHPDQVALANAGYAPTAEEIAAAERIVAAFRAAEASGAAAIQVDGQMVDYPIAQRAERLLKAVKGER